jgi:hypothetical protein
MNGQIVKNADARFPERHKDSFGFLRTALSGVTTWTDRQIRNTGVVVPHIAKNDIFTYNIQLNHDLDLESAFLDDFHIHFMPVGASAAGEKIAINFGWGIYSVHSVIPDVLPNTGTAIYTFTGDLQYGHELFEIISDLALPAAISHSSFVFVKCQRRNDAQDTYASEIALLGADSHYITDRLGSKYVYSE